MSIGIIGVSVGNPNRRGIGVIIIDGAAGEVVDAATITPDSALGDAALSDAASRTAELGRRMAERVDGEVVVWAVEALPGRTASQHARAAAQRPAAVAAREARMTVHGGVVACAPVGVPVLHMPHQGTAADASTCPAALSGKPPARFSGERGMRREVQRSAWAAAEQARRLLHPATADGYMRVLRDLLRGNRRVGFEEAAVVALASVARPAGVPVLTPTHLAQWSGATEEYAS